MCKFMTSKAISVLLTCAVFFGGICAINASPLLADPTAPLQGLQKNTASNENAAITLNAILTGDGRRLAVINGETVGEGERFNGGRLISITQHGVLIDTNGKQQRLKLQGAVVVRQ